ncbi:hypothetical protein [Treponema sp. J25]|uniref:hypothetical protein n=1 Tax=Treponema sp. J25 TaxID=2094121 RepID=UPI00104F7CEA|nr:hypothetical protein [Treponema sp. J25]TCW60957.1 hypothetical protein C5O22_08770 [Treponema sp. J25]
MIPEGDRELLTLLPPLRRGRGYRLYAQNGKRYLDLWQQGGWAILGHDPHRQLLLLKNTLSRGCLGLFPQDHHRRLFQALASIFPERTFRIYRSFERLEQLGLWDNRRASTLGEALLMQEENPWGSPGISAKQERTLLLKETSTADDVDSVPQRRGAFILSRLFAQRKNEPLCPMVVWRPFGRKERTFWDTFPVLLLILPTGGLFQPAVLAVRRDWDEAKFPPSDIIPPPLETFLVRGIWDIQRATPLEFSHLFPRTLRVLDNSDLWIRVGPYVWSRSPGPLPRYAPVFKSFLEEGVLLPPHPALPIILPREVSKGEDALLARLFKELLGKRSAP